MTAKELTPPLYWKMTDLALKEAKDGMDHRAQEEIEAVEQGVDLKATHGQAIRDFVQLDDFIQAGFDFLRRIKHRVNGEAVDVGSGTGVGAGILSRFDFISKVYAVEFSEQFVLSIMPVVFGSIEADNSKIQRVVGDFNNLQIPDASQACVLDIDSFHHAEDLDFTLRECARVLKTGGVIVSIDRAWDDHYTRAQLEAKLDVELNDNLKKKYGIPEGQSFTRRDFGEHEYTVREWLDLFAKNGFEAMAFSQWHPPFLNRIWLRLPMQKIMMFINAILYKFGKRRFGIYGFGTTRRLFVCIKRNG
ncbi:MAG TPA: class I SAM-dependent methyltransferase [Anaerolineales bacterium]|nr:class I SAM-dependent methyltransferase [Anaerolineales bacterium]